MKASGLSLWCGWGCWPGSSRAQASCFHSQPGSAAAGVGPSGSQEAVGRGIKQGYPLNPRWPRAHVRYSTEPAAQARHMAHTWGLQLARRFWGTQGVGRHQEGQVGFPLELV